MPNELRRLLGATEAPFLLALLFGTVAWGVTHIVNRSLATPILEISSARQSNVEATLVECVDKKVKKLEVAELVTYSFRNISRTQLFKDVKFLVRRPGDSGAKILGARLKPVAPALPGREAETCDTSHVVVKCPEFHPGWEMTLSVGVDAKTELAAHISSTAGPVLLKEKGLETWLVRNETRIVVILVVLCAMLVALYLVALAKRS